MTFSPYTYILHHLTDYTNQKEPYEKDGNSNRNQHIFCLSRTANLAGIPFAEVEKWVTEKFPDYISEEGWKQTRDSIYSPGKKRPTGDFIRYLDEMYDRMKKGQKPYYRCKQLFPTNQNSTNDKREEINNSQSGTVGKDSSRGNEKNDAGTGKVKGDSSGVEIIHETEKSANSVGVSEKKSERGIGITDTGKNSDSPTIELTEGNSTNSIVAKGNAYYFYENNGKGFKKTKLSNFTMQTLYMVQDDVEPLIIVKLTNERGRTASQIIPLKELDSGGKMRFYARKAGAGQFMWYGTSKGNEAGHIDEILFKNYRPAKPVQIMGWQPDEEVFCFGNGVVTLSGEFIPVDEYGMCVVPKKEFTVYPLDENGMFPENAEPSARVLFIPGAASWMRSEKDWDYQRDFRFTGGKFGDSIIRKFDDEKQKQSPNHRITFAQWSTQMAKVFGDNAHVGICFTISALFSDIIYKAQDFFPILFPYGRYGTGKSAFSFSLLQPWGNVQELNIEGNATKIGILRTLNQTCNSIVFVNEFSNRAEDSIQKIFKPVYDRESQVTGIKSTDLRTNRFDILSACILAGEEYPIENISLFSRVILLGFENDKFTAAQDTLREQLSKMEHEGLSHLICELLPHRALIAEHFKAAFDHIMNEYFADLRGKDTQMATRLIRNYATIITPLYILMTKGGMKYPIAFAELIIIVRNMLIHHHKLQSSNNPVDVFFRVVQHLCEVGLRGGPQGLKYRVHYKDVDVSVGEKGEEKSIGGLALRIGSIYTHFSEQYQRLFKQLPPAESIMYDLLNAHPAHIKFVNNEKVVSNTLKMKFCEMTEDDYKAQELRTGVDAVRKETSTTAYVFDYRKLYFDTGLRIPGMGVQHELFESPAKREAPPADDDNGNPFA